MEELQLDRAFQIASLIQAERSGQVLSESERAALDAWREENAAHESLYEDLQRAEIIAEDLARMERYDLASAKSRVLKTIAPVHKLAWRRWAAVAAAVLLIAAGTYFWQQEGKQNAPVVAAISPNDILPGKTGATLILGDGKQVSLDPSKNVVIEDNLENKNGALVDGSSHTAGYNTIITKRAQQYPVHLPDGTYILVDANTTLKYSVDNGKGPRRVEINGRAWFEVAHDPDRPFIVTKDNKQVQVLGTHFDVSAYDDEPDMKVTLLEGSVKVNNGAKMQMLKPGQQASLSRSSEQISLVTDADLEQATGWKDGRTVMHHADVATLMREISRWYDVDVEVSRNVPTRDLYFSVSRGSTLQELLKVFDNYKLHYQLDAANRKLQVLP